MREFFKSIVVNLYSYCGNRQAEKMTDEELTLLYDALCRVSKIYDYIPEEKQKEIIEAQLLRDKEYQNINARLISKWLEENGKHFFTQQHHRERLTEADYTPLEGEERDKAIQTYLDALARVQLNFSGGEEQKGNGARMREQLDNAGIVAPQKETSALDEYCQTGKNEPIDGVTETKPENIC